MEWTKSTYSSDVNCVEFRTSSYCDTSACVEVATHDVVQVRDSKDPDGPVLSFPPASWTEFVAGVKSGEFATP